jgi:hypothetical protein
LAAVLLAFSSSSVGQDPPPAQNPTANPTASKNATIIGCLSGPDVDDIYTLVSMQHRSGIQVLSTNGMREAVGSKVKLTGSWLAPSTAQASTQPSKIKPERRFQPAQVEVLAQTCQAPSAPTPPNKQKPH